MTEGRIVSSSVRCRSDVIWAQEVRLDGVNNEEWFIARGLASYIEPKILLKKQNKVQILTDTTQLH